MFLHLHSFSPLYIPQQEQEKGFFSPNPLKEQGTLQKVCIAKLVQSSAIHDLIEF